MFFIFSFLVKSLYMKLLYEDAKIDRWTFSSGFVDQKSTIERHRSRLTQKLRKKN